MEDDIAGLYRHYKGNEYEVLGVGLHTETAVVDGAKLPRFQKLKAAQPQLAIRNNSVY